jgi:hypothetical protein
MKEIKWFKAEYDNVEPSMEEKEKCKNIAETYGCIVRLIFKSTEISKTSTNEKISIRRDVTRYIEFDACDHATIIREGIL